MEIEVRKEGKRVSLVLSGKLTRPQGADLLRAQVDQLLQEGWREFVLDLECVPYIDSEGLGEIVRLYTTVIRKGGTFTLLHLTKRVEEALLSITKLRSSFSSWFQPWVHPREWTAAMWFAFSVLLLLVIMIIRALGSRPLYSVGKNCLSTRLRACSQTWRPRLFMLPPPGSYSACSAIIGSTRVVGANRAAVPAA